MQREKLDPIDAEMDERFNKTGNAQAIYAAEAKWDQEMNRAYQAAMRSLTPKQKDLLKASQQEWLRFRDREKALLDAFLPIASDSPLSSTSQAVIALANAKMKIVRARALALRTYRSNPLADQGE